MADIPPAAVHAAYEAAKRVHRGEISEVSAQDELSNSGIMSTGSAYSYIRNFAPMLAGKRYHFTINAYATRYFLENILADFGVGAAHRALTSVRSHLAGYRKGRPGQLTGIETICNEFERSLEMLSTHQQAFEHAVEASKRLSRAERARRLAERPRKPVKILVRTYAFTRNPHVVAMILERAMGSCELCRRPAPFFRTLDGEPYLEVHHTIRLADGGEDTVENAVAACPNCHREAHFGPPRAVD
jgi:5-methylcytosine-specific restriction protein A